MRTRFDRLTLNVPEKLQLYGLHVYYVVHICDFGMLRVKKKKLLTTDHSSIHVFRLQCPARALLVKESPEERQREVDEEDVEQDLDVLDQLCLHRQRKQKDWVISSNYCIELKVLNIPFL